MTFVSFLRIVVGRVLRWVIESGLKEKERKGGSRREGTKMRAQMEGGQSGGFMWEEDN